MRVTKNSPSLYKNSFFSLSHDNFFYFTASVLGISLILFFPFMEKPLWAIIVYLFTLTPSYEKTKKTITTFSKTLPIAIIIIYGISHLLINPLWQTTLALSLYLFYVMLLYGKIGPYRLVAIFIALPFNSLLFAGNIKTTLAVLLIQFALGVILSLIATKIYSFLVKKRAKL